MEIALGAKRMLVCEHRGQLITLCIIEVLKANHKNSFLHPTQPSCCDFLVKRPEGLFGL